jgi:glycosyltransferase involved in cell wall biosynthesis
VVQGCCPLKIVEAMASGTPLITSDLPVVRDLAVDGREALLVKPGSAKAIKDAMLRLRTEPDLAAHLSRSARARVEAVYTWEHAGAALVAAYRRMFA